MPYIARFEPATLTRAQVDATPGALVLEFGTNWCGWCQRAQPHIKAAFEAAGEQVRHVKVEDGRGRPLGRSFGVKLWPTLVFLRDGHELDRITRPGDTADVAPMTRALQKIAADANS